MTKPRRRSPALPAHILPPAWLVRAVLIGIVAAFCAPGLVGCGTSCPEIRDARRAFGERQRETHGPDARMALPFVLLDRVIAGELARRPTVSYPVSFAALDMDFPLDFELERVTTRAARPGQLGLTLHLGLFDRRDHARVVELEVDTSVAPVLMRANPAPELAITLRPADLGLFRPRITDDGQRRLGAWFRAKLPGMLRPLLDDRVVGGLADEVLDLAATHLWPQMKKQLGAEALLDARFVLPELPIDALELSSTERALVALITTDLADAAPLRDGRDAVDPVGERVVLRMSGGTAMGLVNRAMDRGEVPARFSGDGKPKADGPWEARVGWRGGSSPLVVHLWRVDGACKHAEIGARVRLALRGDTVNVAVDDGRLLSVDGPAFAEAFAWLEGIFGSAFAGTFDTDAFVRFEAGDRQVQLRLARVQLGEAELVAELDLGVAPR